MSANDDGLFRLLHNEGDGGIWEAFDASNARVVAAAILGSDWLSARDAEVRRAAGEQIAQALEKHADQPARDTHHSEYLFGVSFAARIAREVTR